MQQANFDSSVKCWRRCRCSKLCMYYRIFCINKEAQRQVLVGQYIPFIGRWTSTGTLVHVSWEKPRNNSR